jgi:hypothetical protein
MYSTFEGHEITGCISVFSVKDASSSSSGSYRVRDRDGKRTFARQSLTHIQREIRSSVWPSILADEIVGDTQALR